MSWDLRIVAASPVSKIFKFGSTEREESVYHLHYISFQDCNSGLILDFVGFRSRPKHFSEWVFVVPRPALPDLLSSLYIATVQMFLLGN